MQFNFPLKTDLHNRSQSAFSLCLSPAVWTGYAALVWWTPELSPDRVDFQWKGAGFLNHFYKKGGGGRKF